MVQPLLISGMAAITSVIRSAYTISVNIFRPLGWREHKGYRPVHLELQTWVPADGEESLKNLLREARALGLESNVGPQFQALRDFWPHDIQLTEAEARSELSAAVESLRVIRDELNA